MKTDLTDLGRTALGKDPVRLDEIDEQILGLLQDDCKQALADIGAQVGLSAPSVLERVRKLENHGVITGYHARIDARRLGLDLWAMVGVSIQSPKHLDTFVQAISGMDEVLECHHVTGEHTVMLKIKTRNTASLESLLSRMRYIEGVGTTQTMVVLSTFIERVQLPVASGAALKSKRKGK